MANIVFPPSLNTTYIFFCQQFKQTHTYSVKQTDSSTSIWTTKNGYFLPLRARLSAITFCVRGI